MLVLEIKRNQDSRLEGPHEVKVVFGLVRFGGGVIFDLASAERLDRDSADGASRQLPVSVPEHDRVGCLRRAVT